MRMLSKFYLMKNILFFISFLLLFSCNLRKKIVYFGNFELTNSTTSVIKIKKDDLLQIMIYNGDDSNSKIYNLPSDSQNGNLGYFMGNPVKSAYLVDLNGDVEIPNLGKIHVLDLTMNQVVELIKTKASEFINKPNVFVRIQNFKITVLGDVKNPGTIQVPNEKMTIIEALGIAGDLNISANRSKISVLRENNGNIQKIMLNMNDNSVFNSPAYYLQQNDVVYVEPNRSKINSSLISSASGVFISVASLIITTINVITK